MDNDLSDTYFVLDQRLDHLKFISSFLEERRAPLTPKSYNNEFSISHIVSEDLSIFHQREESVMASIMTIGVGVAVAAFLVRPDIHIPQYYILNIP